MPKNRKTISCPKSFQHTFHVTYDPVEDVYHGLPVQWRDLIGAKKSAISDHRSIDPSDLSPSELETVKSQTVIRGQSQGKTNCESGPEDNIEIENPSSSSPDPWLSSDAELRNNNECPSLHQDSISDVTDSTTLSGREYIESLKHEGRKTWCQQQLERQFFNKHLRSRQPSDAYSSDLPHNNRHENPHWQNDSGYHFTGISFPGNLSTLNENASTTTHSSDDVSSSSAIATSENDVTDTEKAKDALRKDINRINSVFDTATKIGFLKFVYRKYPPREPANRIPDMTEKSEMDRWKKLYCKAIVHYHPDKVDVEKHGLKWKVLSGEITKLLTKHYGVLKWLSDD